MCNRFIEISQFPPLTVEVQQQGANFSHSHPPPVRFPLEALHAGQGSALFPQGQADGFTLKWEFNLLFCQCKIRFQFFQLILFEHQRVPNLRFLRRNLFKYFAQFDHDIILLLNNRRQVGGQLFSLFGNHQFFFGFQLAQALDFLLPAFNPCFLDGDLAGGQVAGGGNQRHNGVMACQLFFVQVQIGLKLCLFGRKRHIPGFHQR